MSKIILCIKQLIKKENKIQNNWLSCFSNYQIKIFLYKNKNKITFVKNFWGF